LFFFSNREPAIPTAMPLSVMPGKRPEPEIYKRQSAAVFGSDLSQLRAEEMKKLTARIGPRLIQLACKTTNPLFGFGYSSSLASRSHIDLICAKTRARHRSCSMGLEVMPAERLVQIVEDHRAG